ncbi:GlxA family transcriptional regulator [Arcticibacter tournemirensis]|uniref:Helix-turn-helix domain-containing protein n=1 Tax=Arcticibacter tournemirensis TaxID=699437 RepID=A0A4V1KIH0_9SPHI|nr:helix-turn-helix domain-containing protein [Arcticibacter tournemirensis]RXF70662.1 helix-turn-helix domain-containing protein [Arcticibacter tournemirensis]
MKHISILVPRGNVALSCIEGSFTFFNKVNDFLSGMKKPALFDVQLVGLSTEAEVYHKLFKVTPDVVFNEVRKTDLIIIPAVNGDMNKVIEMNKEFLPWMVRQYHTGAELASLCVGAFLLASTGLLNGKKCATHWVAANEFRKMFPEVILVSDKIITDERGIYSSGGANSFLNLILYLIEKHAGRDISILCAKMFEVEIERDSQSSFIIFEGQKEHGDEAVKKAQEYIEENFHSKISVDQLADMFSVSRRNLERRFKKATSNTTAEYMQRVKIEAAKLRLESSRDNVNEVMYKVGYTDTKAFRNTFKRITGLSPLEYRNKYNRRVSVS